jgi:FkbM family methyltransferase
MTKFVLFFIDIFDYFHKKKILEFLKKELKLDSFRLFIDIGGHHGETIDLFCKNFNIEKIISIEASPKNFNILKFKTQFLQKKFSSTIIKLECLALGDQNKLVKIKEFNESSSSTIKEIDQNSIYFKKKFRILNLFKKKKIYNETEVELTRLNDYLVKKNINEVDFLKIDTEGSEFDILKGSENYINNIKIIYFEHHYDLMLKKKYKFKDINNLLLKNNFKKVYKIKMPFRKVFEYIYINENNYQ